MKGQNFPIDNEVMELQYESDGVSHDGVNRVLHHMLLNQEVPSPVSPIRYAAFFSLCSHGQCRIPWWFP